MIRPPETPVYALELLASAAYAAFLQGLKRKYEPDWTWLTVAGGVVLSMLPVMHLARTQPGSWRDYERRAVAGFCTSGVIIIGWQLWQAAVRQGRSQGYALAHRTTPQEPTDAHPAPPLDSTP